MKKECADFRHQAVQKLQALPSGFAWKSVLRCLLGLRVLLVDMLEKVLEQIHSDVTILAAGVTPERQKHDVAYLCSVRRGRVASFICPDWAVARISGSDDCLNNG